MEGNEDFFIKKTPTKENLAPTSAESNENKRSDDELLMNKLRICRGVVTEKLGTPNVYETAKYLYFSLYNPNQAEQLIPANEKFPDDLDNFKKTLSTLPLEKPTQEEFIEKIRYAMTNGVDFSECISEEAKNQLRQVMEKSEHTVIWTDGDGIGVPAEKIPGSKEQLKKLASAQFINIFRKELAQEKGLNHKDILSVIAQEGKIDLIPVIMEKFSEKGINRIIIVEDRMQNLVDAMKIIRKQYPQIEVFPVWTRLDEREKNKLNPEKTLEEWSEELHAIDNISKLMQILQENAIFEDKVKVGSIFDFDGPLNDDYKRKELQAEIVIKTLRENNWV